jgi:hypothetical protein
VQLQVHDARRSLIYEMPRSTPIPSNQSPDTKHAGGASSPCAPSAMHWPHWIVRLRGR